MRVGDAVAVAVDVMIEDLDRQDETKFGSAELLLEPGADAGLEAKLGSVFARTLDATDEQPFERGGRTTEERIERARAGDLRSGGNPRSVPLTQGPSHSRLAFDAKSGSRAAWPQHVRPYENVQWLPTPRD